jgi:hypothetical protein
MQHKVLTNSILKLGDIKFCIDNGRLLIHAPGEEYPFPLTGQQTHALYNLLCDYRTDIVTLSVVEQRAEEKRKKEASSKKPKTISDTEAEEIRQQLMRVFNQVDNSE